MLELGQRVDRQPLGDQRVGQGDPELPLRVGTQAGLERLAGHRFGIIHPPGPHQVHGEVGEQPLPDPVLGPAQLDRALQNLHRDRGCLRRSLTRRAPQQRDRVAVARRGAPNQMLGDGARRGARVDQQTRDVHVEARPDPGWHVLVQGLTDQVVAKCEPVLVPVQDPRPDRLSECSRELAGWPADQRRQVPRSKRRAEHGGEAQQLERLRGKEAEPVKDRRPDGTGQTSKTLDLGRPGDTCVDRPLVLKRRNELADEERIAARGAQLADQVGAGGHPE